MTFISSMRMPDIGSGAGYALWAFRASAIGHSNCPALVKGYAEAFGDLGRLALGGVRLLAHELGTTGGRRVSIAAPGCCRVTADELSIVALLSGAQSNDDALCDAHLAWLLCGGDPSMARAAAASIGSVFLRAGFFISRPDINLAFPRAVKPVRSYHSAGNA